MTPWTGTSVATPQFRGPRDTGWRPLGAEPGKGEKSAVGNGNMEDLRNTLLASLQMQHLVVLAGSGCSLSAGGPSMDDLWTAVVGESPTEAAKAAAHAAGYAIDDRNVEALLSRIEASLQVKPDKAVSDFLNNSKKAILDQCASFLSDEKLEGHQTFLHRLSRRRVRDQRLKVFTSNYDLCFERTAALLGGVALDGFSFTAPRRYDPRFFSYDIVRRSRTAKMQRAILKECSCCTSCMAR